MLFTVKIYQKKNIDVITTGFFLLLQIQIVIKIPAYYKLGYVMITKLTDQVSRLNKIATSILLGVTQIHCSFNFVVLSSCVTNLALALSLD